MGTSETNRTSIQTIEEAAFIICLDDASPCSAIERCRQFLFANAATRWFDKSLQLIICTNGVSASLYEHSSVDGAAIEPLQTAINEAIERSFPQLSFESNRTPAVLAKPLSFSITGEIEQQIVRVCNTSKSSMAAYRFSTLNTELLSASFLRKYRCPVQSGIQLATQLALRRFFGSLLPAQETVSLAHFQKGRVEVHHTIQPAVAKFLDAAVTEAHLVCESDESLCVPSVTRLRDLFYEAAVAHAKSLTSCSEGRGFSRHLLALEWVLEDVRGERRGDTNQGIIIQEPELFQNEVYKRMKPGKIMTSCFRTGWEEGGFIYPIKGGTLIYFDFDDQQVRFSIFGNEVESEEIGEKLKDAFAEVKMLLEKSGASENFHDH